MDKTLASQVTKKLQLESASGLIFTYKKTPALT